jgi:hypothetical protein
MPQKLAARTRSGNAILGWKLGFEERDMLLRQFPPRYARVLADHVTLAVGVSSSTPLPQRTAAKVVGRTDDNSGVEALVVEIDGSTDRPGGGTYHITWSLADARRPKESNDVLADRGWQPLDKPATLHLTGARIA